MPDSLEVTARHFLHPTLSVIAARCQLPQSKPDSFASSLKEGASGVPQALHFSRKLFRTAKGPIPEGAVERSETGGVCSRRAHEQQLFPVWKTAIFPAFSTRKNGSGPVLKTWGRSIPDWRKINRRSGTVCRMQRKSFDFLFYKRQNACIFIQNFPESGCLNYGVYRADPFLLLKTQWKKWKTSRKTRPFLHKSG